MRTSNIRPRKFSLITGKILMALVFASMVGGLYITPAFGRDDDRSRGYRDHGRQEGRYEQSRRAYQPRRYHAEPVYAPPPVVYAPTPYQSPGITLVFPFTIR